MSLQWLVWNYSRKCKTDDDIHKIESLAAEAVFLYAVGSVFPREFTSALYCRDSATMSRWRRVTDRQCFINHWLSARDWLPLGSFRRYMFEMESDFLPISKWMDRQNWQKQRYYHSVKSSGHDWNLLRASRMCYPMRSIDSYWIIGSV